MLGGLGVGGLISQLLFCVERFWRAVPYSKYRPSEPRFRRTTPGSAAPDDGMVTATTPSSATDATRTASVRGRIFVVIPCALLRRDHVVTQRRVTLAVPTHGARFGSVNPRQGLPKRRGRPEPARTLSEIGRAAPALARWRGVSGRFAVPIPGRGAVWLARLTGGQEVGGSNPLGPTGKHAGQSRCSWWSHRPRSPAPCRPRSVGASLDPRHCHPFGVVVGAMPPMTSDAIIGAPRRRGGSRSMRAWAPIGSLSVALRSKGPEVRDVPSY